jgi:hypothetical protein
LIGFGQALWWVLGDQLGGRYFVFLEGALRFFEFVKALKNVLQ